MKALLILIPVILLTGCGAIDSLVRKTGVPVSTNYVQRVSYQPLTNVVYVTNQVPASLDASTGRITPSMVNVIRQDMINWQPVTNIVAVTNYAPKPSIETAFTIGEAVGGSINPLIGLVVGGLGTVFGSLFGFSNRRRAQQAAGRANTAELASGVLVENVEEMKKLAIKIAQQLGSTDPTLPGRVNDYANDILAGTQQVAGVEEYVRGLLAKHTGNTRQDVNLIPK